MRDNSNAELRAERIKAKDREPPETPAGAHVTEPLEAPGFRYLHAYRKGYPEA